MRQEVGIQASRLPQDFQTIESRFQPSGTDDFSPLEPILVDGDNPLTPAELRRSQRPAKLSSCRAGLLRHRFLRARPAGFRNTRGNLKAVQKLLGHSSISTTGDIYTDWDIDQLAETLRGMLDEAER
jgi:integrase